MTSGVYIRTEKHRQAIKNSINSGRFKTGSKYRLGVKVSWQTKFKMSKSHMGKTPWNKGVPMTKKQKELMVKGVKEKITGRKYSLSHRKAISKGNMGKHVSKETREKISHYRKGKKLTEIHKMAQLLGMKKRWELHSPTSIEKKLYDYLSLKGVIFEKQKMIENKFIVDAFLPELNTVIEADGDYWHSRPDSIKRDKARNAYLNKCGFILVRITETEINNGTFKERLNFI